jgi:hypothetical protein
VNLHWQENSTIKGFGGGFSRGRRGGGGRGGGSGGGGGIGGGGGSGGGGASGMN